MSKAKEIKVGYVVAFNNLSDCTWFEVLEVNKFDLTVRQHGTDYAEQRIDSSYVKQIRTAP